MNATRILTALEGYLKPLAAPEGVVSLASDPASAITALEAQAPGRFGLCLVWNGWNGQSDKDLPNWQEHSLSVFVRVPEGMSVIPGAALTTPQGRLNMSVLEVIEWARLAIMRLVMVDRDATVQSIDPRGFLLQSSEWWRKEDGTPTFVHELKWSLHAALDVPAATATVAA